MSRKYLISLLVGVTLLAAAPATAGPGGAVRGGNRDRVAVISAKDFNLKNLEGNVVLVAFWQSQCEHCEAYIKWMTEMQARHLDDGLVVVAVNQDRDSAAATDLLNRIHPRSQVVLDPTGRMAARYEIDDMPCSYLHDRNLGLQDKFPGFVPEDTKAIEAALVKLLEQKHKD